MENIITLKEKAKQEIYEYIDKKIRPLPKNDDGSFNEFVDGFIDNDVDALRHAYVSGAYALEFSEGTAEITEVKHLFRGYSDILEKLTDQGVDIEMIDL